MGSLLLELLSDHFPKALVHAYRCAAASPLSSLRRQQIIADAS